MSVEGTSYRICKKCLLREMQGKAEDSENLQTYIENIDPDDKASAELYEERLNICKECEMLLEGMCRSCGCYVELRAAVAKNYCPHKHW